jgi:hypothetical protein
VDFRTEDILGKLPPIAVQAASCRLNTRIPHAANKYAEILEEQIISHNLIQRLGEVHTLNPLDKEAMRMLNAINSELGKYMCHAEKKCRKIKSGCIPFLPEALIWIRRTQVYRLLLKYHPGKIRNRANLKRAARHCRIPLPLSIPIPEIHTPLQICISQCNYFRKHGQSYCQKHLS